SGRGYASSTFAPRAPCHHVAPVGLGFHGRLIRRPLGRLDDLEARGAQDAVDLGGLEEDKVQAGLDSPQLLDVPDFAPDVKGQGEEPAREEDSQQLLEYRLKVCGVEMDDRVEGDDSSKALVRERQLSHVALLEFDGGAQLAGDADHLRGEVQPADRAAALVQVPSDVTRPAAEIRTSPASTAFANRSRNSRSNGLA